MKKTIFFMLCLAPLGVQAASYTGGVVTSPSGGTFNDGIDVNNIIIGYQLPEESGGQNDPNTLYAGTQANEAFTLLSGGDISVSNNVEIAAGHHLGLGVPSVPGSPINMTFGSIMANGSFAVEKADLFKVLNNVSIADGFSLQANSVETGAIMVTGGITDIDVSGALSVASFSNSGSGTTAIAADSIDITVGDIENGDLAGNMTITSDGNIDVAGSVYNSNSEMNVSAGGDITVAGVIKNDSDENNEGSMVLSAANLTVSGGNAEEGSFANSGDLTINVKGTTNLEYGFDLSAMGIDNKFSLTTGTLIFGNDTNSDMWLNVFSNKLNQFTLNITNSDLDIASNIINGLMNDDVVNPTYNKNANMSLTGLALSVDGNVSNYGNSLVIKATEIGGNGIEVKGDVVGGVGSTTSIASAALLNVIGDVSNNGSMSLNGTQVQLASASNNGGDLSITSLTNEIGKITIAGDVTNKSGTTNINAKDIEIVGNLTNVDGTTTVKGSDTDGSDMQIGAIAVEGGTVNIDALLGGVNIAGALSVTGDGTLNIDSSTYSVTAAQSIQINGNFNVGGSAAAIGNGDVYVDASGPQNFIMSSTDGALNIDGNVLAEQSGVSYNATLAANTITVGGKVTAVGANNNLTFGTDSSQQLTVNGAVSASNGATIGIVSDDANISSLSVDEDSTLLASGSQITATTGAIDIAGGVWFNASAVSAKPDSGLIVENTNSLTLKSDKAQVEVGGPIALGAGNTLSLESVVSTVSVGGMINTAGTLNINADGASTVLPNVSIAGLNVLNGGVVNIDSAADLLYVGSSAGINVNGNMAQGAQTGALNILADNAKIAGTSLDVTGEYSAVEGSALYEFSDGISFGGNMVVANEADVTFDGETFAAKDINNSGTLNVNVGNGITLSSINNTGTLALDSGTGIINVEEFVSGDLGTITLEGKGFTSASVFDMQNTILYQNYVDALTPGSVNVVANNYVITANQFNTAGIEQVSGSMQINASDVDVLGDIDASDLRFAKNPADTWIDAYVNGSVSGGVDFWGIKRLDITGNYVFNNDSDLWAAIMPYGDGNGNTSNQNYWSTIEATTDNSVGEITNAEDGAALITVGDQFVSNITGIWNNTASTEPQVGITLFDTVDQGTAIWLLHAENGINVTDEFTKLRNLDVRFCNADGSICIDYLDTLNNPGFGEYNGSDEDLPVYISERDTDGDGVADSLYVVFDPAFGGPAEIFKIQPIVGATVPHTEGEYVSAGALDNLIAGQLLNTKFFNSNPIELLPQIFKGTNLSEMANELYERMEYYNMTGEREPLARFSRLFQAREVEQIAGSVVLNEHTNFRDFEDRMFDEFIWNRNRSLKKAWLDVDYGMFFQNVSDGKHADGQRFSIAGGFDWQNSETTILGLTARVSNSSSDNSDAVELGYLPNQSLLGTVDMTVDDLNIGLGGYMMKILGEKTRLYGNAFLDIHLFDISRDQTFVDHIDGSGSAFSLISEWGLMHDWLNQYIVGNAYARVGYNFGFDVTEHAAGQDYMNMQSDGYLILTPGYSLIAQKRIYPSSWFQMRPYASVGVEYDVLGAPDYVKYKFALAHTYTKYDVDIDPLWANIGGGIEFLSATGIQVGIDYRYQYNDAIQLHNIKVSGSYRF